MGRTGIPVSVSDIDPPWLTNVLRAHDLLSKEDEVESFDVEPVGLGVGQTGDSSRLKLCYAGQPQSGKAPDSVFAKFPTSDATRRKAAQTMGLYRREVNCYELLLKDLTVRAPACYFSDCTAEGDQFALLLEDFPSHRPGDETVGLTLEEARLAVDLMTQLHGPYWGRMEQVALPPLKMLPRNRYADGWDKMQEHFGDLIPESITAVKSQFLDAVDPLQNWLISAPCTLGHGDLRLDNLLFNLGGRDPIVAVDWQAARPSKGVRDLEYLIAHSMDVENRRLHERDLLRHYVERINGFGIKYSFEDAVEDYRRTLLFDFITVIHIIGVHFNTHERAVRRKRGLLTRATTAILDWDALSLLPEFA